MAKATWGGQGLFGLHFHIQLLKEIRAGTQTGQEPGGRSLCRGHEGALTTHGLLNLFLIEPGSPAQG